MKEINFIDKTREPANANIKTCCDDPNNNFTKGWYDQIYHTKGLGENIKYVVGDIDKYKINDVGPHKNEYYTSDHKPVFAIIE